MVTMVLLERSEEMHVPERVRAVANGREPAEAVLVERTEAVVAVGARSELRIAALSMAGTQRRILIDETLRDAAGALLPRGREARPPGAEDGLWRAGLLDRERVARAAQAARQAARPPRAAGARGGPRSRPRPPPAPAAPVAQL